MIDFLKSDILTTPEHLYSNPNLVFGLNIDSETGEVIKNRHGYITRVAQFGQLEIKISQNYETKHSKIELSGSLHKQHQGGANFNDYTFNDVTFTINQVCDLLRLSPDKFVIRHIEFGVNIKPINSACDVLNSIVAYKGKSYETREYNGKGYMKRFCLSQYDVKIYDKSKQYGLVDNILRFELKIFKMQYFEKRGIQLKTFNDLLYPSTYEPLIKPLITCFDNIYMFDYRITLNAIKCTRERLILTECTNTNFWSGYRVTHSAKGYTKKVKRFKDLVKKYAPDNLQLYIRNEIQNKWIELLNSTPILPHVKNAIVPQCYPLIVGNVIPLVSRYCLTCGKDITHQKNNSQFCSEKLNGPMAKKCRNTISNFKVREQLKYNGLLLFDVDVYLLPQDLRFKKLINEKYAT
jgi:hypothetical protein